MTPVSKFNLYNPFKGNIEVWLISQLDSKAIKYMQTICKWGDYYK
jgi:hypothetical protein